MVTDNREQAASPGGSPLPAILGFTAAIGTVFLGLTSAPHADAVLLLVASGVGLGVGFLTRLITG